MKDTIGGKFYTNGGMQNLRQLHSSEILLYVTEQNLANDGFSDMAIIIEYLIKNPNKVKKIKAFCENKK